jgi:hypothetical protein
MIWDLNEFLNEHGIGETGHIYGQNLLAATFYSHVEDL